MTDRPQKPGTTIAKAPGKAADELEQSLLEKATTPQERALAFQLASRVRQSQMIREASAAIAEFGWGKDISPIARAAVSRYCLEVGLDPVRHVFVLGGTVFINGTYYRDVIAANPKFDHADDPEWIDDDPRLAALEADTTATEQARTWAKGERERRRIARIENKIPDECPAACIITLYYSDGRGPFKGIGRVRFGKTQKGYDKDPIGLESPRESAETRGWREAGEKAEPVWFRQHPSLRAAQEVLIQGRDLAAAASPDKASLEPVAAEEIVVQSIAPEASTPAATAPRTGVIEHHEPTAICSVAGEHPRTACGYHKAKANA